jgi:Bacterial transcriptional activator domain
MARGSVRWGDINQESSPRTSGREVISRASGVAHSFRAPRNEAEVEQRTITDAAAKAGDAWGRGSADDWRPAPPFSWPRRPPKLLMEAFVAEANPAEAVRVYERLRRLLSEELAAYASTQTQALHERILRTVPG